MIVLLYIYSGEKRKPTENIPKAHSRRWREKKKTSFFSFFLQFPQKHNKIIKCLFACFFVDNGYLNIVYYFFSRKAEFFFLSLGMTVCCFLYK